MIKLVFLLSLFILIPSAFAHQPSQNVDLTITNLTNHSMTLNWSSATFTDKNHHTEILACGGVGCTPLGTLNAFTKGSSFLFDGTAHEGLPSGSTWGFIVKECHRTGILSNQVLCKSSSLTYGTTI